MSTQLTFSVASKLTLNVLAHTLSSVCTCDLPNSMRKVWHHLTPRPKNIHLFSFLLLHAPQTLAEIPPDCHRSHFSAPDMRVWTLVLPGFTVQFMTTSSHVSTHSENKINYGSYKLSQDGQIGSVPPVAIK